MEWLELMNQEEFLNKSTPDKNLIRLMVCMGEAMRTIAFKVRTASCGATACINTFGDEQLAVDLIANKLLFEVRFFHLFFSCKISMIKILPRKHADFYL